MEKKGVDRINYLYSHLDNEVMRDLFYQEIVSLVNHLAPLIIKKHQNLGASLKDKDDLVSHILYKISLNFEKCYDENISKPSTFLIGMIKNEGRKYFLNKIAKTKRKPLLNAVFPDEEMQKILFHDRYDKDTSEKAEILKHLIEILPRQQKRVIKLHYYEGYTIKECAKIMSISESSTRTHLCSALKNLKKLVRRAKGEEVNDDMLREERRKKREKFLEEVLR